MIDLIVLGFASRELAEDGRLSPLSPRVVRSALSEAAERRLLAAFTEDDGDATGQRHAER